MTISLCRRGKLASEDVVIGNGPHKSHTMQRLLRSVDAVRENDARFTTRCLRRPACPPHRILSTLTTRPVHHLTCVSHPPRCRYTIIQLMHPVDDH
jgi:hypothetical protein